MEIFWFKPKVALVVCKQTPFDFILEKEAKLNWNVWFFTIKNWTIYFRVGRILEP